MNCRTVGYLSGLALLFHVQAGSATMSDARPEPVPDESGIKLVQCGGYGASECAGAKPDRPTEATPSTAPPDVSSEQCPRGGYGVSECPQYTLRSNSSESGKGNAVPRKDPNSGCDKSGYGVAECAGDNKQAGDQSPPSGAGSPGTSSPADGSELPVSELQQCKIGCAPQCNAFGSADLAAQCRESCEAKCDAAYGKKMRSG